MLSILPLFSPLNFNSILIFTFSFLLLNFIQAMGIKMVLSGEGADEIFAGYLYFHKCPNPEEMQAELKDKIR